MVDFYNPFSLCLVYASRGHFLYAFSPEFVGCLPCCFQLPLAQKRTTIIGKQLRRNSARVMQINISYQKENDAGHDDTSQHHNFAADFFLHNTQIPPGQEKRYEPDEETRSSEPVRNMTLKP